MIMHKHSKASLAVGAAILVAVAIATTVVTASSAVAVTHESGVKASVAPSRDIVGSGLVNCAAATGEVGYSPASISGGTSAMMISIWFDVNAVFRGPWNGRQARPQDGDREHQLLVVAEQRLPIVRTARNGPAEPHLQLPSGAEPDDRPERGTEHFGHSVGGRFGR